MHDGTDDFLADDGMRGIKGIASGGGAKAKGRTPRPIKPPGVYVNGKATAKAVRQTMKTEEPPPVPPERLEALAASSAAAAASSSAAAVSLQMDDDALEEYRELAEGGSSQYSSYLNFSLEARLKLEGDVSEVLGLLETAAGRAGEISSAASSTSGGWDKSSRPAAAQDLAAADDELLALLEERNADLEGQLTGAWDEVMVKDEGLRRAARALDDAQQRAAAAADRAATELAKANAEIIA